MSAAAEGARALLNAKNFGILSTISLKLGGFPFGSVVPYCLDGEGRPVVLISSIAQHTKNVLADDRCSITVVMDDPDVQASGRLCVIGHMEPLPAEEIAVVERYERHFPKSKGYHSTHDFSFYRLRPVSLRYIAGFGSIHWIEPADFLQPNPFHGSTETRVVSHMNEDHHGDLVRYCEQYKGLSISPEDAVRMVGIDGYGFDVYVGERKVRFEFEQAVADVNEARAALVAMSRGLKNEE